ncbi:hypothetical protein SK803_36135 [Lentzea sp. BCCO 10_0856]|uniref:Uncharacterized protein n=1 Tax=Lentzea miocenica TaxID=3095431 RepID=A0ABU4TCP5_9PSEU|nr:hypothetical protein [Lentzea sp. BCCO 10_0856]MDX8035663.1 hypothetical protein [Lentzea sp. BCCO 10_0856]
MSGIDDAQARGLTLAAVGALNRRDHVWAGEAVQILASDERSRTVVVDTCASILLRGVPRGSLDPSTKIPVAFLSRPGDEAPAHAVEVASDVLSALACDDQRRVASVLRLLADEEGFDVLLVLVRAAAAWIDAYVGIDGDTVDAYYAISKEAEA